MKKYLIVVLIVVLALALLACGASREEKIAEEMLEKMMGDEVDLEINEDGDSVNIKTEDGDMELTGGENGTEWPTDKMPENVPKPNGVTFTMTMITEGMSTIGFEGCDQNECDDYVEQIKAAGWEIISDLNADGVQMYQATDNQESTLQFTYSEEDGAGSIVYFTNE